MGGVVMCGCHIAGYEAIERLLSSGVQIDYFVLLTKQKAHELKISGYYDFEPLAKAYYIPIYYVEKYTLKSVQDLAFFEEKKFDLLIQGGWQRLFPQEVLKTLRVGAIGGHGSSDFLPKGRGRSPLNWSLIQGAERFVAQFFIIKPGVDDGDIFFHQMFDINPWDNIESLYQKMSIVLHRMYLEWIPKLLSEEYRTYPQVGEPTYFEKRTPEDGLIDWNRPLIELYNFIRAITDPYPGAFTYLNGEKVLIKTAVPFDTRLDLPSQSFGQIVEIFKDQSFLVKCSGGLMKVSKFSSSVIIEKGMIFENDPNS